MMEFCIAHTVITDNFKKKHRLIIFIQYVKGMFN